MWLEWDVKCSMGEQQNWHASPRPQLCMSLHMDGHTCVEIHWHPQSSAKALGFVRRVPQVI